jgi:hypothetical protein
MDVVVVPLRSRAPRDALLPLLPPFGARVRAAHVVERSRLPLAVGWAALGALCAEGIATVLGEWLFRGRAPARRAS